MPERSSITAFKEVLDDIVDAQQLIDSSNSLAKSFESINLKSASDHNAIIEKTKNIIDQLKEKVVTLHNNFHKHYSIWKNTKKTSHVSESNSDISENQETNLQELTVDDSFDMMSHNTNNDILVANVSVNKKNIKDNSEIVINNITKNIEHSVTDLIVGIDENVTSKGGTNNKADMIDNNKRKCDQSFSNVFSVDSILQLNLSEHNTTDIADHVTVDQLSNDKINELNKSDERTCNNAVMKNNVNDLPANDNSNDLYSSSKTSKNKEANRLDSDVTVKDESAFKIKCVDIKKLLEPDIASPNVINKNKVSEIPNTPTTSPNINTSVVIISDSDNDTSTKTHTKAKIKGNKNKKKENNLKISLSKKRVIVVDDSDSDYNIGDTKNERRSSLRNEFLKHRKTLNRSRSKRLENISSSNILNEKRPRRNLIQDLTNVSSLSDNGSSSSSSSDDSHYDSRNRKKKVISKNKKVSCENRDIYSMNVKDKKFSCKAYVPLPRLPSEELKENYKKKLENIDIRRLTNMESLKRLRKYSTNSVSSNSSAATSEKKRHCSQENGKDLANKEKSDKDADISTDRENHKRKVREASESSNISASSVEKKRRVEEDGDSKSDKNDDFDMLKEPTPNDPRKNEDEIAKALLDGIGSDDCNSNHNSDSASKISDKEKDVNKNKNKDQSNKQEKKDRKEQTVNTDDTDAEANKEKNKWRKDKLLTENITDSDSGEDFTRFLKKKEVVEGKKSDTAEKTPNKSKKRLKRRKAVLGSDSDSSASAKSESASSKSKSESSESERNSDSDNIAKKPTRRRIKKIQDSSAEDDDNGEDKSTRKNIRKVWKKKSLADTTIAAEKEEEERKARIAEKQKKYNLIFESDLLQKATVDKVVLDFNEETKEELLKIDQTLVKHLKPHQAMGIQFMWDACFESIDRARKTKGSGCILAHCMGLGKTLQVISLIHTLVNNDEKTGIKKVLVVCPLSTVLNWVAEFKKWLTNDDDVEIYELVSFKQNNERMYQVKEWDRVGGALIVGYDMYRNLTNPTNKRLNKKIRNTFHTCLVDPGPDLVVCDEGHLLKNEKTSLSIAMNRMQTLRRIVLTGTPLQNNLKEYFCMVQFVKPNLLGTYREYLNRFVNPITNGQYTDSTQHDIHIMRKRSHVLHKLLDGVVQRKDYSVLAPFLPPKHEYVLFVSLTEVQIKLYEHYMREKSRRKSCDGGRSFIFTDFNEFQRICTHPRVLLDKSTQLKQARDRKDFLDDESEGSLKDFIDDDETEKSSASSSSKSSGDSDSGSNSDGSHKKNKKSSTQNQRLTRSNASTFDFDKEDSAVEEADPSEWWQQYCQDDDLDNIAHSGKLSLLFEILRQCELIGDKVLVFSQSLYSLNVIEYFLSQIDDATQNSETNSFCGYSGSWSQGLDYFRLDGSSSCENRAAWCKTFNDSDNTRARLFLISTKAGGLGINLVAANRVIIFDVSWNPSHDTQSIYRVYRFGQTKPSFIYRFVTLGTMEMKVYERQVIKQAISKRVIDEQQIDRHYNQNDLAELYRFEPIPEEDRPTPLVPKDLLLGELLQMDKKIYKYHEHQSLLENKVDEVLDEEERKAAWEEFENEKKARSYTGTINNVPVQSILIGLQSIIRKGNPTMANEAVYDQATKMFKMLEAEIETGKTTLFNKAVQEVQQIQAAHARMLQYQQEEFFRQYAQQVYNSQINPYMMNRTAMHNYPTQRIPSSATFAQAAMENQNPVEYIDLND